MKTFTIVLCDNDFGRELQLAMEYIRDNKMYLKFRNENFLDQVISIILGYHLVITADASKMENIREYLDKSIAIMNTSVNEDHDGGSISLDIATGYIWRF